MSQIIKPLDEELLPIIEDKIQETVEEAVLAEIAKYKLTPISPAAKSKKPTQ